MLNNNIEQESQDEEQMNGMDEYGSKVLTSEFTLEQAHIIIVAGNILYNGLQSRAWHIEGGEGCLSNLIGLSGKEKEIREVTVQGGKGEQRHGAKKVLFVEQTQGGS